MDEKEYNEAFKRAKELHEAGNALTKQQMEIVFPQLAESEDEKAYKRIEQLLRLFTSEAEKTYLLAYLEKQKEQKSAGWSEDWREEAIQTRFAFYTYQDDPGTLYLSNVFVEEASRNHGFGTRILRAAEKVAETIGATTISLKVKQNTPANTWYRKNGYGFVAFEDGYDWLEKNLEYMKPNEPEWSETDEWYLKVAINIVEHDLGGDSGTFRWLKALPGRIKPQPKQEQSEVEIVDESPSVDWDAFRREAAKVAMQGILASGDNGWSLTLAEGYKPGEKHSYPIAIARFAIACADELIEQLKEESK